MSYTDGTLVLDLVNYVESEILKNAPKTLLNKIVPPTKKLENLKTFPPFYLSLFEMQKSYFETYKSKFETYMALQENGKWRMENGEWKMEN